MQVTFTMDWREHESDIILKCQDLEATLGLYTADDIDARFDQAEYKEKLKAIEEAYKEVNLSIGMFLQDYESTIPAQQRKTWKKER